MALNKRDYDAEIKKSEARTLELQRLKTKAELVKMPDADKKNYEANGFVTFGKTVLLMAKEDANVAEFIRKVFAKMTPTEKNLINARVVFSAYLKEPKPVEQTKKEEKPTKQGKLDMK